MTPAAAGRPGWRAQVNGWLAPGPGLEWTTDERVCARCHYGFPGGTAGAPRPCIECGAALDPAVPGTLIAPGPGTSARWLMHAPGLWYQLAVLAGCALCFIGGMAPAGWFGPIVLGLAWLAVTGAYGVARIFIATALAIRWKRLQAVDAQPGWWLPAAIVAGLVILCVLDVPARLGFRLQRPRLEAARAQWEALPPQDRAKGLPQPVDLWTPFGLAACGNPGDLANRGRYDPTDGFAVGVHGTGFLFDSGAYYCLPRMDPQAAKAAGLEALGDGWYAGSYDPMD